MTTSNPSAAYFEKVASQWDDLRAGYFTEAVREAAIGKAYLHPEMTVADVGAGTGFIAAGLAPLVKHVHVLDGSAAMLDVARSNLAHVQQPGVPPGRRAFVAPAGCKRGCRVCQYVPASLPRPAGGDRRDGAHPAPCGQAGDHRHGRTHLRVAQERDGGCVAGLRARADAQVVRGKRAGQRRRGLHGRSVPIGVRQQRGGACGDQHLRRCGDQAGENARRRCRIPTRRGLYPCAQPRHLCWLRLR